MPDLVTTAKGIAGGFPLAAVTGRADIMDSVQPGGVGGTFGGNPVSTAAALAVFNLIERDDLLGEAKRVGEDPSGSHRRLGGEVLRGRRRARKGRHVRCGARAPRHEEALSRGAHCGRQLPAATQSVMSTDWVGGSSMAEGLMVSRTSVPGRIMVRTPVQGIPWAPA
ncbi:hypothetical protein JF66_01335 [Cryobacterium sp. MLB-32]|uniref:aminotransferase class III-fold pyridoxal phosphate-dependent enzyme n=1 Tax=Cryobacterium sp. MLB-32 TaxID=1529318 RepID=UPI0004E62CA9|nr:aminotransferase class III-fold pyridoxal phosphate-dependent enzyme [Cryobacterium sp. MLB-32]KFF60916.1 hypothetical protein JF66_01335 [Cryobacterium sp. MLB-32]